MAQNKRLGRVGRDHRHLCAIMQRLSSPSTRKRLVRMGGGERREMEVRELTISCEWILG